MEISSNISLGITCTGILINSALALIYLVRGLRAKGNYILDQIVPFYLSMDIVSYFIIEV